MLYDLVLPAKFTRNEKQKKMLTSLPLQIIVLLNTGWIFFVIFVSIITLIVKGCLLLYPSYAFVLEMIGLMIFAIITFANFKFSKC